MKLPAMPQTSSCPRMVLRGQSRVILERWSLIPDPDLLVEVIEGVEGEMRRVPPVRWIRLHI